MTIKMSREQESTYLSSAAIVIGALRVKKYIIICVVENVHVFITIKLRPEKQVIHIIVDNLVVTFVYSYEYSCFIYILLLLRPKKF